MNKQICVSYHCHVSKCGSLGFQVEMGATVENPLRFSFTRVAFGSRKTPKRKTECCFFSSFCFN